MSTTKHTPGPWDAQTWNYKNPQTGTLERSVPVVVSQQREMRIAELDSDAGHANPYTIPLDEASANARLIAAAPDLLGALKALFSAAKEADDIYGEQYGESLCSIAVWQMVAAAIAKAEERA
jgi:hypothetical protein